MYKDEEKDLGERRDEQRDAKVDTMTRSILIALLRSDLRLHDHAIFSACRPGSSALPNVTHVVPVYVFDQKYVEVGGITGLTKGKGPGHNGAKTRVAGFWRCGPHRTR